MRRTPSQHSDASQHRRQGDALDVTRYPRVCTETQWGVGLAANDGRRSACQTRSLLNMKAQCASRMETRCAGNFGSAWSWTDYTPGDHFVAERTCSAPSLAGRFARSHPKPTGVRVKTLGRGFGDKRLQRQRPADVRTPHQLRSTRVVHGESTLCNGHPHPTSATM